MSRSCKLITKTYILYEINFHLIIFIYHFILLIENCISYANLILNHFIKSFRNGIKWYKKVKLMQKMYLHLFIRTILWINSINDIAKTLYLWLVLFVQNKQICIYFFLLKLGNQILNISRNKGPITFEIVHQIKLYWWDEISNV